MNFNLTIDEEPFGRLVRDEIEQANPEPYLDVWEVLMATLEVGVIGGSVAVLSLLVYIILRFNYLQTSAHFFLMNYAICYGVFLIFSPLWELALFLGIHRVVSFRLICTCYRVTGTMLMLSFCFGVFLGISWLIMICKNSWYEKFEKLGKYFVVSLYVFTVVYFAVTVRFCFGQFDVFTGLLTMVIYTTVLVINIFINCVTYFKKLNEDTIKYKYLLTVSTSISVVWVPVLIFHFVSSSLYYTSPTFFWYYVHSTEFILEILLYCLPYFIVSELCKKSNEFKKAYDTVLKGIFKNYKGQSTDVNDDNVPIVNEQDQEHNSSIVNLV